MKLLRFGNDRFPKKLANYRKSLHFPPCDFSTNGAYLQNSQNKLSEKFLAIQGIIAGFANPTALSENLLLVGRGDGYILVVDGVSEPAAHDLETAQDLYDAAAARQKIPDDWVSVTSISNGNTKDALTMIDAVGTFSFGQSEGSSRFSGSSYSPATSNKVRPN